MPLLLKKSENRKEKQRPKTEQKGITSSCRSFCGKQSVAALIVLLGGVNGVDLRLVALQKLWAAHLKRRR